MKTRALGETLVMGTFPIPELWHERVCIGKVHGTADHKWFVFVSLSRHTALIYSSRKDGYDSAVVAMNITPFLPIQNQMRCIWVSVSLKTSNMKGRMFRPFSPAPAICGGLRWLKPLSNGAILLNESCFALATLKILIRYCGQNSRILLEVDAAAQKRESKGSSRKLGSLGASRLLTASP